MSKDESEWDMAADKERAIRASEALPANDASPVEEQAAPKLDHLNALDAEIEAKFDELEKLVGAERADLFSKLHVLRVRVDLMRKKLDPKNDPDSILGRIGDLASRLASDQPGPKLAQELLRHAAYAWSRLITHPPEELLYQTWLADRLGNAYRALNEIGGAGFNCVIDEVLDESAPLAGEPANVSHVRKQLQFVLPRLAKITDAQIEEILKSYAYRVDKDGNLLSRRGRPARGTASERDKRYVALAKFLKMTRGGRLLDATSLKRMVEKERKRRRGYLAKPKK